MESLKIEFVDVGGNWPTTWRTDACAYLIGPATVAWPVGIAFSTAVSFRINKRAGPLFSVELNTALFGVLEFENVEWPNAKEHESRSLNIALEVANSRIRLTFNKDLVCEREDPERGEAQRLALPWLPYCVLKERKRLRLANPPEPCHLEFLYHFDSFWGREWGLADKQQIVEFLSSRKMIHKRARERYAGWLAVVAVAAYRRDEIAHAVGTPINDNGTDLYFRAVDAASGSVRWTGLQICEMPEKYLPEIGSIEDRIVKFVSETKLRHYATTEDWLIVWLDPKEVRDISMMKIRELFDSARVNPFQLVILLFYSTAVRSRVELIVAYSRNHQHYFNISWDFEAKKMHAQLGRDLAEIEANALRDGDLAPIRKWLELD